jgi:hypothetical protein
MQNHAKARKSVQKQEKLRKSSLKGAQHAKPHKTV